MGRRVEAAGAAPLRVAGEADDCDAQVIAQQFRGDRLIAREPLLSPETSKHHLKAIFAKLGVRARDDVLAEVRRRTLV